MLSIIYSQEPLAQKFQIHMGACAKIITRKGQVRRGCNRKITFRCGYKGFIKNEPVDKNNLNLYESF
jgi:hypothetical protein